MVVLCLVRTGKNLDVRTESLCMVKIGVFLVNIGCLKFGRMKCLLTFHHVGHLQVIKVMDLIHLIKLVMGRMMVLTQISILELMGVMTLALDGVPLTHNLMVILWDTRMVGRLLDPVGPVGRFSPIRMITVFCRSLLLTASMLPDLGRLFMRLCGVLNCVLVCLVWILLRMIRLNLLGSLPGFLSCMLRVILMLQLMIPILIPLTRMFLCQ
ncbi:hypothetical protein ES332_A03G119500v1 [Gossypium tomentosum]|uniref:Uncharacterized protein n=1 Tax=Gossypium tomentosum TaxID=34277 RepID=A0A5D2R8Q4_GOSTO|nr:hypothetical protein ES332_A03G119500v1 [Gossypium tomentosum]